MKRVVLLVLTGMFGGALLLQSCEKEPFGPNCGNPGDNDSTYVDPNDTIYNGGGNGGGNNGGDSTNWGGGGNPGDSTNWGGGNNGGGNGGNGGDTIIWGGGGNPGDSLGG